MIHVVESIDDPRIRFFRNVRDRDLRGGEGLFVAESTRVIERLLASAWGVHSMLLTPQRLAQLQGILPEATPVFVATEELLHGISGYSMHGGAIALGCRLENWQLTIDERLGALRGQERMTFLMASGVTHMDNVGSLFRSAAAFGVDAIVLDHDCCDPLLRKAIRYSMGHVLQVPFARSSCLQLDLERLKGEWGMRIVALEAVPGARGLHALTRHSRLGILVGSEGHGVGDSLLRQCEEVVAIPMSESVPSLNVAVAAAIALHERQRDLLGG